MASDLVDRTAPAPARTGALARMPGLDGVRAVAVAAVLLFHANPTWLPGGFLGVDVFFTLSGFLITSLLLTELQARGGIRFGRFYQHRAKRLLPAMFAVLIVSSLLAMTVAQDAAARLREDVVASAFYVTNWWYVAHGTSYFDAIGRPPLLQHLWSLAVEEQFYLVWPLILYVLWRIGRVPAVRVGAMVGVLASTAWMAWIAVRDGIPAIADSGRVYFGTDTHAMTLLAGAVLATYWTQEGAISALTDTGPPPGQPARARLAWPVSSWSSGSSTPPRGACTAAASSGSPWSPPGSSRPPPSTAPGSRAPWPSSRCAGSASAPTASTSGTGRSSWCCAPASTSTPPAGRCRPPASR